MTSSPLFMSVDESTVIFGPIFHVGCDRASSRVTVASDSAVRPRNGPPLAVSTTRATSCAPLPERSAWCTAQCSLSTGMSSAPGVERSGCTTGPAAMRLSLFASPSTFPARSVSMVTGSPANPMTPFTTTSACPTTSVRSPDTVMPGTAAATCSRAAASLTTTTSGLNSRACSTMRGTFGSLSAHRPHRTARDGNHSVRGGPGQEVQGWSTWSR